jgi:hypothetical protein
MSFTGRDQDYLDKTLTNNGFMPNIKLADFQEQYRVANEYAQSMVEQTLLLAMIEINTRLKAKQTIWMADGIADLQDVPNQPVENGLITLYLAAVMHWAKGELIRRYPTVTTRKTSDVTSKNSEKIEDWYRSGADQYVRQILGKTGITCELL